MVDDYGHVNFERIAANSFILMNSRTLAYFRKNKEPSIIVNEYKNFRIINNSTFESLLAYYVGATSKILGSKRPRRRRTKVTHSFHIHHIVRRNKKSNTRVTSNSC